MADSSGARRMAAAAMVLSLIGVVLAFAAGRPETAGPIPEGGAFARLEERIGSAERRLQAAAGQMTQLGQRLDKLGSELDELRSALGQERENVATETDAPGSGSVDAPGASPPRELSDGEKQELANILRDLEFGAIPRDDLWATLERARELGAIDDALEALEAFALAHPYDADAHVALGDAYVIKLLPLPQPVERGLWSMKAIRSYDTALGLAPEHWDARFGKAMNLAEWPAYLGKQSAAIEEFEILIRQQESQRAEPRFAQTYVELSRTYQKAGKPKRAKEVIERGVTMFPEDESLQKQRDLLGKR